MSEYKKKLVLIPSAYNSKVMGDVENFIKYYKDDFDVYVIYDSNEKEEDGVKYINKKNKYSEYLKITADYIIDAGSINYKTRACDTQKRVSVWHGIPYKKMFVDMDQANAQDALEYDDGIDLMVSPCKFYTEEFLRRAMLYSGEILETAVSRTDSLFKTEKEKDSIKKELGIPLDKKILLYAPTFRKKGKFDLPFDASKLLEVLNEKEDEWVIVTKLHYLNTLNNSSDVIDCTSYPSVNNILAICDLMISDYSSLFFDYSILKKPAIFYQYDQKEYMSDRGFMFDLEDYVDKKYIVTKEKDLIKLIKSCKNEDNLSKIRKTFYPHQKEDSTKELVKKLNFDSTKRKTKDIIFLVNELNEIGGVHNFLMNLAKEFKAKYNSRVFVIATKRFSSSNKDYYEFDKEGIIDLKLSADMFEEKIIPILENTDGYIISCQFGAHKYFQKYLNGRNNILMFHGDTKDIIKRTIYPWHLNALNNYGIYNYKKLLLLTKSNVLLLGKKLHENIQNRLDFMENSFDFSNRKNYYKENGEFAFISRLDYDKNVFDIIKIFSDKKINKNYKIHIYGDGKLRSEFEEKVKELKLEKRIIVHGYCDNKDEMYKDKQGIILTSLSEGFPLTILEAINYGVPLYLYNSFTAAVEFKDYSVVKLIETSNIDKFVNALNKDNKFKTNDFDKIINRFSNDTIVKRWIDLFDDIENMDNIVNKTFRFKVKRCINNCKSKLKNKLKNIAKAKFMNFISNSKKRIHDIILYLKYYKYKLKNLFKKKSNPLVSLIVPYYHNINTIEALLKSIQKSGYKNYEVLVINDGSDEDPTKICKKYRNVKYVKKQNEGLGMTRNYGINHANGKYLFFIDSDDTMCKGAIRYLVDYAEKHKLDLVSGKCRKYSLGKQNITFWFKNIFKKQYINTLTTRMELLKDTISTAKLYNVEALRKSNIRFETGLYEDTLFMAKIYAYYDKIGIINKDVYNWINYGSNSSITTSYTLNQAKQRTTRMKEIYDIVIDKHKAYYVTHAVSHDMYLFVKFYLSYKEEDRKEIFNLFRDYFVERQDHIYYQDIRLPHKKEAFRCMMNNDFERFDLIAKCISYKARKEENN